MKGPGWCNGASPHRLRRQFPAATNTPNKVAKNQVHGEIMSTGGLGMTWREMVGWGLVAAGSVCGIAAAAI
jgi:hypothetical protein